MKAEWTTENSEVFYTGSPISTVSADDIRFLKKVAAFSPRKQARLCTHLTVDDTIHEMLIVHSKGNYVRPHKHIGKIESFHVIEGSLNVVLFKDDGSIQSVIKLGAYDSGDLFYYRLCEPLYHTILPVSDTVVFHEITNGPFNRSQSCFAPWAPREDDAEAKILQDALWEKINQ